MVRSLLQHGADPNTCESDDYSALWKAAASGNLEIAELLLRHRANVNADPSYHGGGLPISIASKLGHLSVVDALIRHKADVNGSWPAQGHGHFRERGSGPITRLKDPSWSGERLVLFGFNPEQSL